MDSFLLEHYLRDLRKSIQDNRGQIDNALTSQKNRIDGLEARIETLENSSTYVGGEIGTLSSALAAVNNKMKIVERALMKASIINIKQEMTIRTLHNLNVYRADDMFIDTFASTDGINMETSVRTEWIEDLQSIGLTTRSFIDTQQTSVKTSTLISKNGSSDEMLAQSFVISKDRTMDRVSLYVSPFSASTNQPLFVSIRDSLNGVDLTSAELDVGEATGSFVNIDLPDYQLEANKEYFLIVKTNDVYGYKIGMDAVDRYFLGTCYSQFNTTWTDNRYDIGFKIWCYPTADENHATIYTKPHVYSTEPQSIVFEREDAVDAGTSVNYFVSRDSGANYKILQPGVQTDLTDLPPGKTIVLKAQILGAARVDAWGYVITRSES